MQFIKTFLAKKNSNVPVIFLPLVLWFLLWATYNTDITRFFDPNTPRNFLAFFHQVRSFLPFLSLLLGILILRKHKFTINFFKGPLGFLTLYTLVGILASALSLNVWFSFYWGILYVTGIVVLWVIFLKRGVNGLKAIFYLNFFIAGFLALMLAGMFFVRAGSFSWLTLIQFLQGHRPFEGINNLGAQVITLGMAGTRPTGLGRYAGLATLLCLPLFWHHLKKYRILAYIFFPVFLSILIFSRARTSAIALVLAIILMLFFRSQSKINFLFILTAIALILSVIGFFPIFFSYLNNESFLPTKEQFNNQNSKVQLFLQEKIIENDVIVSENSSNYSSSESVGTLSGRTTGIWPESWKLFLTSPIIGRGFFADRIFLQGQHAHNLILQALVQSGALGTLFFLISLFLAWFLAIKLWFKNQSDAILLSAIGMLAYFTMRGITESFVFFGADYLFMVPIFAYLQLCYQEQPQSQRAQMKVLGNKVDVIEIPETINLMGSWIKNQSKKACWIVVTGMHGIMESQKNTELQEKLNSADLFVPDGISLVWIAKLKGLTIKDRVSGADLMRAFFVEAEKNGWSSFFYGDSKDTLEKLQQKLLAQFPRLKIVGSYDSHYKPLFSDEDSVVINLINEKKPDVVWVGRGMPKQEHWIYQYRSQLQVPVVVGVGAAFKFLSGKVSRAPKWVGALGFEWLWRLFTEPKTTFTRVFVDAPKFVTLVALELLKDFFS